jgi:hypothetical protein
VGDATELNMRIPDKLLNPPAFLCVDVGGGQFRMAGTAFFLAMAVGGPLYLVTARHCVRKASVYGNLYVRLNKLAGGWEAVRLEGSWYYPESDADDIAVMSFPLISLATFDIWPMELSVFCATDEVIRNEGIGVGDELIAIGLFTRRDGKHKNRPIVRSGIIAATPDETLLDVGSGLEYHAYLIEIRSIGGLSGSPVFAVLGPGRFHENTVEINSRKFILIGVIRGHWNKKVEEFADFGEGEQDELNTGIAIMTPIQKVIDVIMNTEDLVKERQKLAKEHAKSQAPKEDSALGDASPSFTQADFEAALKKASRKITPKS